MALKEIVVLGGGIIGCSTAYYLSELDTGRLCHITVVEATAVAGGASGKAGGFLARDWCDDKPPESLAQKSFLLHAQLGKEFPGTDYRAVETIGIQTKADGKRRAPGAKAEVAPEWVDCVLKKGGTHRMGDFTNTAQVHPYKLSHALLGRAQERGCTLRIARAVGIDAEGGTVRSVRLEDGSTLPADVVVVAMGAWSNAAMEWMAAAAGAPAATAARVVSGLQAYSVIFRSPVPLPPCALFVEHTDHDGNHQSPEFYPRPDGTLYVCNGGHDVEVPPASTADVLPTDFEVDRIVKAAAALSTAFEGAEVVARQACLLPFSPDNTPSIGPVPGGPRGSYVAAGHGCWGILNAPATGLVVAEMVLKGLGLSTGPDVSGVRVNMHDPARLLDD